MIIAVYPGSFDPITNGHIDIATRAAKIFGKVIFGVFRTPDKRLLFTTEERIELARKSLSHLRNVEVMPFSGLTVQFAREVNAHVMVRGLRMGADFEREFEMAMMNKKLFPDLEMVCFMASQEYQFLSSSLLKEVAALDGNISYLVPPHVADAIRIKTGKKC
ncbi:MAG: pantetheine-phosphate adenylyltransferase [Dehalococcoidales bacterium]|nr:pantetheine-phosphate adenylyltransferase [Dehalococcoidales bacterium]